MAFHRIPNDQLRTLLAEARWTGETLARAVNDIGAEAGLSYRYDRASVAHWLSGMRPRQPVPELVAEAFSRALGRRVTVADTGLGRPGNAAVATESRSWWQAGPASRLVELAGGGTPVYNLAALPAPGWGESRTDMHSEPGTGSRVGRTEVRALSAMTTMFTDIDSAFGGGFARAALCDYLGVTIAPWLRADATPVVRRDLLAASAQLAYLCGFMCFDDRLHGAAQRYYLASLRLATDAGDPIGSAVALRALSVQACALRHFQPAVHLAEAAVRVASNRTPAQTRAFLLGQLALAHAATGDRHTALSHLAKAERLLENAAGSPGRLGAHHPASLAHTRAAVTSTLGERREAVAALRRSIRHRPEAERRSRAITLARLAELLLLDGRLEQACEAWHHFLDDYPHLHSRRATEAFTMLLARTRPHQNNPVARALRCRAATMRRDLKV